MLTFRQVLRSELVLCIRAYRVYRQLPARLQWSSFIDRKFTRLRSQVCFEECVGAFDAQLMCQSRAQLMCQSRAEQVTQTGRQAGRKPLNLVWAESSLHFGTFWHVFICEQSQCQCIWFHNTSGCYKPKNPAACSYPEGISFCAAARSSVVAIGSSRGGLFTTLPFLRLLHAFLRTCSGSSTQCFRLKRTRC